MKIPFIQKSFVIAISTVLSITLSSVANAQSAITMDGTTGTGAGANQDFSGVAGANQTITINGDGANANGTVVGSNLFFSFSQFGIAAGDTALFQCPGGCSGVTNVISRVTGNIPSNFNGTLISLIGTANFWFFNPNGVVVNGAINVPISATYHISNGFALDFSDNSSWDTNISSSTLTFAAPTSFLFETSSPITIEGTNIGPPPSNNISSPNPEDSISTLLVKSVAEPVKPVMEVAVMNSLTTLQLPKNPCEKRSQSTLNSKGIANYIPEFSSQVPTSILTTRGTSSLASAEQTPPTLAEAPECP